VPFFTENGEQKSGYSGVRLSAPVSYRGARYCTPIWDQALTILHAILV